MKFGVPLSAFAFLCSTPVFAADCPNFSGKYKSFEGVIISVSQTACAKISIGVQEDFTQPVTKMDFILDGGRHAIGAIYWAAYWEGDKFVREPWSAVQGGEMVGDREFWSLQQDGNGQSIFDQVVDAEDGTVTGRKVFKKLN